MFGEYTVVTYIARPAGKDMDIRSNPYHPRLLVLDASFNVVEDMQLGEKGFAHVHPTLTVLDDQLFVAWSKQGTRNAPQVQIERFTISGTEVAPEQPTPSSPEQRPQSPEPPTEARIPPEWCGQNPWYGRVWESVTWDLDFRPDAGIRVNGSANPHPGLDSQTGDIWLYTQLEGATFLSISQDGLSFGNPTELEGPGPRRNDARTIQLPDGRWRAYRHDPRLEGFVSATSVDGIKYQQDQGLRYSNQEIDEGWVGVYTTFTNADAEVLLVYLGSFPGTARLALSTDGGENFSFIRDNIFGDNYREYKSCHWLHWDPRALALSDGRIRMFTMVQGPQPPLPGRRAVGEIFSWTSSDGGHAWEIDPVIHLSPEDFLPMGLHVWSLNDPWVVLLPDGRQRMYVAALLSDDADGTNTRVGIVSATTPFPAENSSNESDTVNAEPQDDENTRSGNTSRQPFGSRVYSR